MDGGLVHLAETKSDGDGTITWYNSDNVIYAGIVSKVHYLEECMFRVLEARSGLRTPSSTRSKTCHSWEGPTLWIEAGDRYLL